LGGIVEPPPKGALPWKPAPHPYNEMERLHFLQETGVLDTEPEGRFDAVTKIVARVFDTPIALVSLVDEDKLPLKMITVYTSPSPRLDHKTYSSSP